MILENFYNGKRILLTGHTGFKGSWLAEWLILLGAKITGVALEPPTHPALFNQLNLKDRVDHNILNVKNRKQICDLIEGTKPDILFHLAAQPLVRRSYNIPVETFESNLMGTINILEGLRILRNPCTAIMITTDKCYHNREWIHSYREEDPLGGSDPYSASKSCAEIAISSYRHSYFSNPIKNKIALASARAGNVIGGGDWADDRIVPDCIRSITRGEIIKVRNKHATRPWQHVLEPLGGYLRLAQILTEVNLEKDITNAYHVQNKTQLASSFNFGPCLGSNKRVEELVDQIIKHWKGSWVDYSDPNQFHEASKLNLTIDKAYHLLAWKPKWSFDTTVAKTVEWYREVHEGKNPIEVTRNQIYTYLS